MALEQSEGPLQVVHLGSGTLLMELPPGARALRVALPPGNYLVLPTVLRSLAFSASPRIEVA